MPTTAVPRASKPRPNVRKAAPRASSCLLWLLTALACDPFHAEFAPIEDAEIYTARDPSPPPTDRNDLQLLTYNIKFGGGRIDFFFDCHGDAVLMSEKQVDTHMRRIAELIRELDPDVVFLQEVDVNSKRSAYVDQLQYLLDHTELNHALYASHWRVDFVPSDGLGPVDSGNAIASKYRLTDGTRIALPLREDQPSLDRYFYLRRNVLTARLQLGERRGSVGLVATHTAAYSKDGTKLSHIERFKREMDEMMEAGLVVGAGDLNTLPPDSEQTHDFDDSACKGDFEADDYREEGDWLKPLYDDYASAIPLASYVADNAAYFSHTTSKDGFWNRKLDYIFSNGELEGGEVIQDASAVGIATMPLSDHAPLRATLSIEEL